MLRYDQHPSRQRDAIAQRRAMLDTIVAYRYLTPYKIAADERCEQEMARAALFSQLPIRSTTAPRQLMVLARHRLGAVLIAAGIRLQRDTVVNLDPHPGT